MNRELSPKKWFLLAIALILLILGPIYILNEYIVCPMSQEQGHCLVPKKYRMLYSMRGVKYKNIFIDENYKKYDTYILGSSPATILHPGKFKDNSNIYNLSFGNGLIKEYEYLINKLIGLRKIKKIYLELHFPNFNSTYDEPLKPVNSFEQLASIGPFNLEKTGHMLTTLVRYFKDRPGKAFMDDGAVLHFDTEWKVKKGEVKLDHQFMEKTSKDLHWFLYEGRVEKPYQYSDKSVEILRRIKKTCTDNNIPIVVYIPPTYQVAINLIQGNPRFKTLYGRMKKDLKNIFGDVYFYNYLDPVTSNPDNYLDGYHFREPLGHYIFNQLSGNDKNNEQFPQFIGFGQKF